MGALTPALPGFENGPVELAHPTAKATVYAKDQLLPENTPDAPAAYGAQGRQRPHGSRSPSQKPLHDIQPPVPLENPPTLGDMFMPPPLLGYEPASSIMLPPPVADPLIPAHVRISP